ncbi:MAG TPA: S8 family serine peptidase [Longimicrobiaceae bacterium]|nr:S8 family serine peptidase [Longimicrobiaceae bacterium]
MYPVRRFSLSVLCAAGVLGLAAGAADAAAPLSPAGAAARPDEAIESVAPVRHLVLFAEQGVPAGFAAEVAALGGTVEFSHASGIAIVGGLAEGAASQLGASASVASVQPDAMFPVDVAAVGDAEATAVADAGETSTAAPATSEFFPRQWHHRAIGADRAWAAGRTGSSAVTVAILDSGVDYTHTDLAGLVDLSRSASFVPTDDKLVAANFPGRHLSTDLRYHGTHVAATVSSNARLAAGVTSRVRLMSVKVLDRNGNGTFGAIMQGVLYATDNGADVINMSLGGAFGKAGNGPYVAYINRVFNATKAAGATVVVSAGNDNRDMDHDGNLYLNYCNTTNVICVSATGPTGAAGINGPFYQVDARAPYSNFGRSSVSVAAPGGAQRFVWAACSTTSLIYTVCRPGGFVLGLNGTSMAAPHVSGLAALLVEKYGRNPAQIRHAIQSSADDLGETGTDPFYGKGRINVARALGL